MSLTKFFKTYSNQFVKECSIVESSWDSASPTIQIINASKLTSIWSYILKFIIQLRINYKAVSTTFYIFAFSGDFFGNFSLSPFPYQKVIKKCTWKSLKAFGIEIFSKQVNKLTETHKLSYLNIVQLNIAQGANKTNTEKYATSREKARSKRDGNTPSSRKKRAKSTDREATISLHDFVTDFVAVISSQSEGLGKMALGIVKIYLGSQFSANRRCSRSVGSRSVGSPGQFVAVSCRGPEKKGYTVS